MTFLAVHDTLNTIDRRYRPYAAGRTVARGASVDAAVAAAARTVLVSSVKDLPDMFADCRAAGLQVAEDAYVAALEAIPEGPAEDAGVATGAAAAERVIAKRTDDGADTPMVVEDYQQGTEPGEWRFHTGSTLRLRARVGRRPALRAQGEGRLARRAALSTAQQGIRPGLRGGEGSGWGRGEHAQRPHGRPDRGSAILDREQSAAVEPDRPVRGGGA